jgi:hypothetical protein
MRKIFTIALLIILASYNGFSQTDDTDSTYWGISLYGCADYSFHMVKGSSPSGQDAGFMKDIDLPRAGYLAGFSINRAVGKRVAFEFGLSFQSQGYRTKTLSDTIWNYRDSVIGMNDYHKAYRYNSINIPVILKITLCHIKKATIDLGIGVAPVISIGKKQVLFFDDHTEIINEKSHPDLNVQAIGCLNINIPLGKNFALTLEPTVRYNILPNKDSYYEGVSRNFFTAGLGLYLTYKLTDDKMYDYYYRHIYKNKNLPPAF